LHRVASDCIALHGGLHGRLRLGDVEEPTGREIEQVFDAGVFAELAQLAQRAADRVLQPLAVM